MTGPAAPVKGGNGRALHRSPAAMPQRALPLLQTYYFLALSPAAFIILYTWKKKEKRRGKIEKKELYIPPNLIRSKLHPIGR
jgi:hypothetical protein